MRGVVLVLAGVLLVAGCSADQASTAGQQPAGEQPAGGPSPRESVASGSGTGTPAPGAERVRATLAGVDLVLEIADTTEERAIGLMGRTSVPPGTGMVFRYDALSEGRFYMFRVPIPLTAVFLRDGWVVSSVVMPPCLASEPQDCPTYGADGPFDTVVETDPATLPDIEPGDEYVVLSS